MFRSRINGRLLQHYERRICTEYCGRRPNGTERCFAKAQSCCASTGRGYATTPASSKMSQSAAKAINKPPPGSVSSARVSSTSSTTAAATATAEASSPSAAAALRTAEARESALRAARMRRQAQKQDREAEAAKKREEEREYKKKYNTAARKWVSSIIALPIFFVTSYYLFDRLVLGKQPKSLEKHREEKS
ncbi:hypothetical protein M441DRAFT_82790 [Trichoderma asperellum CBS 433.97]|uniref:Transmembrane protein n=1 Tax=Trichoderma asperellum (strain ATCC 204424 / CBS 433.97 / NBRC 101777) TaxID=1042311 RepID=A0A2T3YYQ3_TRIA4|nr:hypothetical protein M441DRAFT_82790 [Trichoderma asperellum CBS 433.97]PTB37702.1 hypothetical protein M441DRAFT_82790 [Trichoderma asperellum CBS 433.97]